MFDSIAQYNCLRCRYGGGAAATPKVWGSSPLPAKRSSKAGWFVAGATVLGVGIVALAVLGTMHGVFGTSAQTFINQTLPQLWDQAVVPFASSPTFHAGLIGAGVGLATAGALGGLVYYCRKEKPQNSLIVNEPL